MGHVIQDAVHLNYGTEKWHNSGADNQGAIRSTTSTSPQEMCVCVL